MTELARNERIIAYGRSGNIGGGSSVETQRREVEAWARSRGVTIVRWFVEKAVRAPVEERPALMGAVCALGRDARLLCAAYPEALHHHPSVREVVEHVAAHAGGTVVYANGERAPNTGRSLGAFLDVHEGMLLRLHAVRGEKVAAERAATWGRVPWGYRLSADGMSLEPNLAERAVVAIARHMRLRGLKLREIADELRRQGVVNRNGRAFGITRVYELLDQGEGSRPYVLEGRALADAAARPESVSRPSLRPTPVGPAKDAKRNKAMSRGRHRG